MNYQYPIDHTWSKEEVIDVIQFFQMVEQAYEKGVTREELLYTYNKFKQVIPSKSEEKKICGAFEQDSGYSCYHTVKKSRDAKEGSKIRM